MNRSPAAHTKKLGRTLTAGWIIASLCMGANVPSARPVTPVDAGPGPSPAETRATADDIAFLDRISIALSRVARIAKPSVVSVQTLTPQSRDHFQQASGSGVIFDARGRVVTSNHVVDGATQIDVVLADGRKFRSTIMGSDPKTDVAVLQTGATQVTPARFADSSRVEVGHLVLAIGSPFRLSQTVTHGIVSATGRSDLDIEGMDYQNFLQTDAPTNPGNSGGALINTRGEVIGINTAIATGSGQFSGVAFATPSNTVLWAARRIIEGRPLVRGYLGVAVRPLLPELASRAGLIGTAGVYLERITPDSPAYRAGLRAADVVLEIDGALVGDSARFRTLIAELSPGSRSVITVWRDRQPQRIQVVVGEQPGPS